MTYRLSPLLLAGASAALVGCGGGASPVPDAAATDGSSVDGGVPDTGGLDGAGPDAATGDAATDASTDPSAACAFDCTAEPSPPAGAVCFGDELTNAFGRIDGTLLAVQRPADDHCAWPNSDHLIVQVLMHGKAYRMVVNILSDGRGGTDTRLRFADVEGGLAGPPFAEGWHPDLSLDYVADLGVHTTDFTPYALPDLVDAVTSRLEIGAPVSVFATSQDRPESAHLIHRNGSMHDGAIVVGPTSGAPRYLLFHFDGQTF